MALECQHGVITQHAAAIVNDTDQPAAAGFRFDAHTVGACIKGIFKKFLHHRGGALDNFTGRDLIGYCVWQDADTAHLELLYTDSALVQKFARGTGEV